MNLREGLAALLFLMLVSCLLAAWGFYLDNRASWQTISWLSAAGLCVWLIISILRGNRKAQRSPSSSPAHISKDSCAENPQSSDASETIPSQSGKSDSTATAGQIRESGKKSEDAKGLVALGSENSSPGVTLPDSSPAANLPYFGDYLLLQEIGRGGMGVVYKARQSSLNRVVAIKMILFGKLADDSAVRRFQNEAESIAQVSHPNIVAIYEIAEHQGHHYFSMEFVEGGDITNRLTDTNWKLKDRVQLLVTVARAIHHAHQRGIIHRDLKPSNILMDRTGRPKVTDFGLARRVEADGGLTQSGSVLGTPNYMAPEQALGLTREIATPADIWSLGVILYQLACDTLPFTGCSVPEILRRLVHEDPVPPSSVNEKVDQDLDAICLRCLEKSAENRFGSAAEFADELDRWLRGEPTNTRPPSVWRRTAKWAKRNPAIASLSSLTAIGAIVSFAAIFYQWRQAEFERGQTKGAQALIDIQHAENFFEAGDDALGLARLAAVLRRNPGHRLAVERLINVFNSINYALPGPRLDRGFLEPITARFSRDGTRELITPSNAAVVINSTNKLPVLPPLLHDDLVYAAVFSPDGKTIATAAGNAARLWDPLLSQLIAPPIRHGRAVKKVGFEKDGQELITVTADGVTRAWSLVLNQPIRLKPAAATAFMQFDPSARYLFTSYDDRSFQIWDSKTSAPVADRLMHPAMVRIAGLSGEGKYFATLAEDDSLRVWMTETNAQLVASVFKAFRVPLRFGIRTNYDVQISGDRKSAYVYDLRRSSSSSFSFQPRMIRPRNTKDISDFHWETPHFALAQLSPDGSRLLGLAEDGSYAIWQFPSGTAILSDPLGLYSVVGLPKWADFSPDSSQAAVATDYAVSIIKTQNGSKADDPMMRKARTEFNTNRFGFLADASQSLTMAGGATWLHFSSDGRYLYTVLKNGKFSSWDLQEGGSKLIGSHQRSVTFVEMSEDCSKAVTCSGDNIARLWDLNAAKLLTPPLVHSASIQRAWFTADGSTLVTLTTSEMLQAWDCASGTAKTYPIRLIGRETGAKITSGRTLNITMNSVQVKDARTGELLSAFMWHAGRVRFASFSPDGERIVTCSADNTARIWDAKSGYPLSGPLKHKAEVIFARFSADGQRLATASDDKTIYVWDLPTPGPSIPKWLPDIAEGIAGQRLTTKGTFQPVTGDTFFDILNEIAKSDPAWREPWMRRIATNAVIRVRER